MQPYCLFTTDTRKHPFKEKHSPVMKSRIELVVKLRFDADKKILFRQTCKVYQNNKKTLDIWCNKYTL